MPLVTFDKVARWTGWVKKRKIAVGLQGNMGSLMLGRIWSRKYEGTATCVDVKLDLMRGEVLKVRLAGFVWWWWLI